MMHRWISENKRRCMMFLLTCWILHCYCAYENNRIFIFNCTGDTLSLTHTHTHTHTHTLWHTNTAFDISLPWRIIPLIYWTAIHHRIKSSYSQARFLTSVFWKSWVTLSKYIYKLIFCVTSCVGVCMFLPEYDQGGQWNRQTADHC